ncbi:MAG: MarR family transcriptional regulator [Lachnospiraceae bacterium]|nr:MarR family transcriptional regulator [Lachnospiraceae bacterium]
MPEPNIMELCYRLMNKYNQKTKNPKRYGTDDLLYASEVHMIEVIGTYERITTTKLAECMGITKGAVSQTTSKLLQKDLILKTASRERSNEVFITLTAKGRKVLDGHHKIHEKMNERVNDVMVKMSEESKKDMIALFHAFDSSLDEM